ncbi:hypothetical protein [Nocardiopsis halotolerans]|uniref:hypothetical protein n=1 Tax=Nocardiopsis halotolerans TaxID=124252 RepID=UPI00034B4989|nr:hypothetical protein [Nocardiopsis halotolerans]
MSPSHRDHRSRGTLGTALLAGFCCAGALAYGVIVGPSMLPPQDVQATTAMTPDLSPNAEEPEETVAGDAPTGELRIQVSDRDRAWVQTLVCDGDAEEDPPACAELARAAAEVRTDTGEPVTGEDEGTGESEGEGGAESGAGAGSDAEGGAEGGAEGDAEQTDAVDTGIEYLFTEVREGTVCTDEVYGPQEARISGTWEGQEVETTLSRKGSCEEARWQRLRMLTEQLG